MSCQRSAQHAGPFFTVIVTARECGGGTRMPGAKRREERRVVGRVCKRCLLSSLVRVRGRKLMRQDSPPLPSPAVIAFPGQRVA